MTARYIIFLTLFYPSVLLGQNLSDSLLATFFNKALTSYFPDTTLNKDQKEFGYILIQTDFNESKLIKTSGVNNFKFFDSKTEKHSLLSRPLKKNKDRKIYSINYNTLKQDTVDINIYYWNIAQVDKHSLRLEIPCGGTTGDIPDARFIYNKATDNWIYETWQEVMKQKSLGLQKK